MTPAELKAEKLIFEIRHILRGITEAEMDSVDGYWETNSGAAFGRRVLSEVEQSIRAAMNEHDNDPSRT